MGFASLYPSYGGYGLQQLRLLGGDRISNRHSTISHHLGIDAAFVVAEALHQGVRDGEVARAGVGIDIDGGAAGDAPALSVR